MHRQVLVMVAESTGKRIEAESNAQRQEILRDARMLALVALLVWWGVSWALAVAPAARRHPRPPSG